MRKCEYCGTPVPDGKNKCEACGAWCHEEPKKAKTGNTDNVFTKIGNAVSNTADKVKLSDKAINSIVLFLVTVFFGVLGIHRFISGKIFTGILWLLTGGLFFIGYIIDIIINAVDMGRQISGSSAK